MQQRRNLAAEVTYLDPDKARFFIDAFEDLNLELAGDQTYSRVRVKRAFPLTRDDCFIVVQDRRRQGDWLAGPTRRPRLGTVVKPWKRNWNGPISRRASSASPR